MQAHVKTPRIKIDIEGDIPVKIIAVLHELYGSKVSLVIEDDDEPVDVFQTEWYKDIEKKTAPGDAMRIYRENHSMTQQELGDKLGGVSRQNVSHMERGMRAISLNTARKLAKFFNVPIEYFLDTE